MPRKPQLPQLNEHERLIDTFVRCFETAEGKFVLAHLKATVQDKSSVTGIRNSGPIDPYRTLVAEGGRNIYLYIKELIEEGINARAGRNTGNSVITDEPSIWDL